MNSSIELNFFLSDTNIIKKFKLPFMESIEDIKTDVIKYNLPDNLFSNDEDKSFLTIILYSDFESEEFLFYIYKGENKVYIGLSAFYRGVYELIIFSKMSKHKISLRNKKLDKLDWLGNKYRCRLTLINTYIEIKFDNETLKLHQISLYNCSYSIYDYNSFQISANIEKEKNNKNIKMEYRVKQIIKKNEINSIKFSKNEIEDLNNFWSDLEITFTKENFYMNYENLKHKYEDIFNMDFPYIKERFECLDDLNNNNDINNLNPFFIALFTTIILNRNIYLENQEFLKAVMEKSKEDLKLVNFQNINIKEKLKILSIYLSVYSNCETLSDINSIKIRNFIFSERENNSILDKVYKFFEEFIESLTEDSKTFLYFLQLNSGIGYMQKRKVYTFDLCNVEMIKRKLRAIFPKFLSFYNYNNSKKIDYLIFCSNQIGGIALNENFLVPTNKYENIDYNSNKINISENEQNEIAMNIILFLLHEFTDHKKFNNSVKRNFPNKKILKEDKIKKIAYNNNHQNKEENSPNIFLEPCNSILNNNLLFENLITMKNKGKLIKRPDLFNDLNEILEKYIILRQTLIEKEITYIPNDELTIEEEIAYIKTKLENELNLKEKEKDNNNENIFLKKFFDIIYEEEENCGEDALEESDEDEEIEKLTDENMKRILKKFKFKYDEELFYNVEKKMDEPNLSSEDIDDLNYLYAKFMKIH